MDGFVFGEGAGEADVAGGFGAVAVVAEGEEFDGVSGAEVLGEVGFFGAGDELEAEGFEADDLGVQGVEGGQDLVVA
ncbi:hypothetical protein ACXJJ3_40235 [Kribbella sp. WER1]